MSRDSIVDKGKQKTPAERAGLKIGDKIKVVSLSTSYLGVLERDSVLELTMDDGSHSPRFTVVGGPRVSFHINNHKWVKLEEDTQPTNQDFKVGDKVVCLSNRLSELEEGSIYTVSAVSPCFITIKDKGVYSRNENFKLACPNLPAYGVGEMGGSTTSKCCELETHSHVDECRVNFLKIRPVNLGGSEGHITFNKEINLISKSNQEENIMSSTTQRRVVNVELIDEDSGLDVQHSLVHDFGRVVTEDSDSVTIQELIMNTDVKGILEKHNNTRAKQVDKDILHRTGKKNYLQPVKLKNLRWIIK